MIHKETIDTFIDALETEQYSIEGINGIIIKSWNLEYIISPNDSDLFIYPNIPSDVKHKIRINWGIELDEEILYVRDSSFWNDRNQGLVITDCGVICIPDNDDMDDRAHILWENVEHVEYKDELLYFFGYGDRDNNYPIHISHFLKNGSDFDKQRAGDIFQRIFTRMAQTQIPENEDDIYEKTVEQYNQLMHEGKEEEALQLALNYREEKQDVSFTPEIAVLYYKKGQLNKAINILDEDIKSLPQDNDYWISILNAFKYDIYKEQGDYINARKYCLSVTKKASSEIEYADTKILEQAEEDFSTLEKAYITHFLEQPYNERKLIVPVQSYLDLFQKKLAVIDINNLPAINFPMGHPVANQLYVGHPYIPSKYIPFENYELELIEDKIREFSQIMQYLGATEINIESVNASSNDKDVKVDQKISGSVDYKLTSASGSGERHATNKFLEDISQHINLHQRFYPKNSPMLPEGLVWYQNEPSWQRLYNQRMQGALLEHEERIETKKSQVVENSELKQISAEVKWLFAQANVNWEQSMEEKFEAHDNAILSIYVKFAPLESLQGGTFISQSQTNPTVSALPQSLTEKESEYLEELKVCLEEDSEISVKERRLLNRLRDRLGISEERAEELESSLLKPQLTEEEQEYLEEYKACTEEGELSPKEIRLLNRLRINLGISEERAKELETLI